MSKDNIYEKDQLPEKENKFLGKKTESSTSFNNIISNPKSESKCKICSNKNDLIKCVKCLSNYCKDCLKHIANINLNKLKEQEYICSNCQINVSDLICFICHNQYEQKNLISYSVDQEQKKKFKNELLNKGLPLVEKEGNNNFNSTIKICNNCFIKYDEIIKKVLNKKIEKEEQKKQRDSNIFDQLTNLISKGNGDTNLDNKSENSDENSKEQKIKPKEQIEAVIQKEINNKEIQINISNEDNPNLNNVNIDNNIIENKNNFDIQKMLTNNLFLRDLNDNNNLNKNHNGRNIIIINKNKNEIINNNHNISPSNINNNQLLNSNILERNINSLLNLNPISQNSGSINSNPNDKTSNLYLPHFFTTQSSSPLQKNQNLSPLMTNFSNNIPSNLLNLSNLNNNINSFNDINILDNSSSQLNQLNNINSPNLTQKLFQNNQNNKFSPNLLNQNNINLEENKNFNPFFNFNQNSNNSINNLNNDVNTNINLNNCLTNLGNLRDGINHLKGLGEQISNANNPNLKVDNKNMKSNYLFNSMNNNGNNMEIENEIKVTLNQISKDLYSFDNNNIENNLSIIKNIEALTRVFAKIINEQKPGKNGNDNINNAQSIGGQMPTFNDANNMNFENNFCENKEKTNNNLQNNNGQNSNEMENNENGMNKQNISENYLNINQSSNPSSKALIDYILSVISSLSRQLKTMRTYIEVQKIFVAIIFQNIELFLHNFSLTQKKMPIPNPNLQQKIPSQNKDILTQNNQNNIIPQINPPPQLPLNALNNLQPINPAINNTSSLLNSSNLNYPSSMLTMPQLLGNNNLGRGLSLFNIPGQQFSNIPNVFNSNPPPFSLYPQQQGVNVIGVGNSLIGLNIPQMSPILNQLNPNSNQNINNNLNNNINNNLQLVNNQKKVENNNTKANE